MVGVSIDYTQIQKDFSVSIFTLIKKFSLEQGGKTFIHFLIPRLVSLFHSVSFLVCIFGNYGENWSVFGLYFEEKWSVFGLYFEEKWSVLGLYSRLSSLQTCSVITGIVLNHFR